MISAEASSAKRHAERTTAAHRLPESARKAARDQIVVQHLPLVRAIAVRVHESIPVHVDLDDLVHAGILGLFDAVTKYQPDKQVAFSAYAKHRIKGAILDSLRQQDWASRDLRRRHKQMEAATHELAMALQRHPTEAEVAEKLGVDLDRWRQIVADIQGAGLLSMSTGALECDDAPAREYPATPESQPDRICARGQLRDLLRTALATLPDRYRKVVLLYYAKELTMREIGDSLGVNESRVSQIHKAALEKMAAALRSAGVQSSGAF